MLPLLRNNILSMEAVDPTDIAPLAYADLILNGDPEVYLKTVTEYKLLD